MKRLLLVILLFVLAASAFSWWKFSNANGGATTFRTAPVEKGDLTVSFSATGTLQPEEVVDVGAQVAGRIVRFGKDRFKTGKPIDYNTKVREKEELAYIDDEVYRSEVKLAEAGLKQAEGQLAQAEAQKLLAKANVDRAEADLAQMQARLDQFERDWQRVERLSVRPGAVSETEFDTAKAAFETSRAAKTVAVATIAQARASVKDAEGNFLRAQGIKNAAEATLDKARFNLGYCTIRSPIDGVIIDRRVNVGQTVVASLNAPSLFLIAKDLKRIQLWTSVNEADIGQVKEGRPVRFTVDARPGEVFRGTVEQVRMNAVMTQNVVTYTVVIVTDNEDGKLRPYLTANVVFEVDRRKDVLMVPNAALRWQPKREQVDPAHHDTLAGLLRRKASGKPAVGAESKDGVVWVVAEGNRVRPITVKIGLSDGMQTEIVEGEVTADDRVVVGTDQGKAGAADDNPFAPKMFRRPQ